MMKLLLALLSYPLSLSGIFLPVILPLEGLYNLLYLLVVFGAWIILGVWFGIGYFKYARSRDVLRLVILASVNVLSIAVMFGIMTIPWVRDETILAANDIESCITWLTQVLPLFCFVASSLMGLGVKQMDKGNDESRQLRTRRNNQPRWLKASVLVLAPLLLCLSVGFWFHFEQAEPDEDFSTLLGVAESLVSDPKGPSTPIGAVPFLRRYLGRAPSMAPGSVVFYVGVRGEYHYMEVIYCNLASPFGLMRDGAYVRASHRCPSDQLPAGFPDDLAETLARVQEDLPDKQLIVDDAIEKYLRKADKLSPEAQGELDYTAEARRDRLATRNKAASRPVATVNE